MPEITCKPPHFCRQSKNFRVWRKMKGRSTEQSKSAVFYNTQRRKRATAHLGALNTVKWCAVPDQLRKYFYDTGTKHSPSLTLHSSPMHFLKTSRLKCEHCFLLVYMQHNMADAGFPKLQATKRNFPCLGVATTCSGKAGKHRKAQQHVPKVKEHCQCWTDGRKEGWKSHPCYKCPTWHWQLIEELQGILERERLFLRKLKAKKWRDTIPKINLPDQRLTSHFQPLNCIS